MKNIDSAKRASLLVSDLVVADYLGDIEVDGMKGVSKLDGQALRTSNEDAKAQRFELIAAAKAGKHIELMVTAQTFAQTKKPNRRYARLGEDGLESGAKTWKGQPYLTDHNTWEMVASKGTILSSKAVEIDGGMAFEQKLHAVKGDAVIGILDGTFNKFSIGWWPDGPVLCSVHNCDIAKLDSCQCWPGDKVTLDGKTKIVEFIYTSFLGKETSNVVIPAVQDTHVDDVRAQLAAELGINHRFTRTTIPITHKENRMRLSRLAAALTLAVDTDHDETVMVAAAEALRQRAIQAETDLAATKASLAQAKTALDALTATTKTREIDAALESDGYAAGKLRRGRDDEGKATPSAMEPFLRDLGVKGGVTVMKTQLKAMPVIVPVGQRPQGETVRDVELPVLGDDGLPAAAYTEDNPYLQAVADQLGLDVKDMVKFGNGHISREVH